MLEFNNGVRDHFEYKNAMFTKSLFYYHMVREEDACKKPRKGFMAHNGKQTRDIICLEFNYGTRSFEEEIKHLNTFIEKTGNELKERSEELEAYNRGQIETDSFNRAKCEMAISNLERKLKRFDDLLKEAHLNKTRYHKYSVDEVRHICYNEGVTISYTKPVNGQPVEYDKIHYKMLYRSTGKAKKGTCMFINERLYNKAINYLRMGINLPDKNAMLVEISAYSPLISSAIIDTIRIVPDEILVLKDIEKPCIRDVISIETDQNRHCIAQLRENYELKNTLFDGQALIDSSIFPEYASGYILLRQHFFKAAAFCSHIQRFFKDYCSENGLDYDSYCVTDMWGRKLPAKKVKLITTDNALKWLKFGVDYDYWSKWVNENDCLFGIVKTAHSSKLGKVQKMSYQMVNSMPLDKMNSICEKTVDYINSLKEDDSAFLEYLKKNMNFANDYEVLLALCDHNSDFVKCSYFRERKRDIIKSYVLSVKNGKLIQDADNLTIVGSPYAMLLYAASGDPNSVDKDISFFKEGNAIQCFTERFKHDEYLAEFRSPFNGRNNLGHLHNVLSPIIRKYFDFGQTILAVNMIGTDFQDRNNGSDQDSDSVYVTNQNEIVSHARWCYENYKTIVNNIPKDNRAYENNLSSFADIDSALAGSQLDIGESSNLAQLAQTYSCTFEDEKYDDFVCILSVLAQAAIDNSKRLYDVNIATEIRRIKKQMDIKKNGYPEFWSIVKKDFKKNSTLINRNLKCPMNYLYNLDTDHRNHKSNFHNAIPISEFFLQHELDTSRRKSKRVESLIGKYSLNVFTQQSLTHDRENGLLLYLKFEELVEDIRRIYISNSYKGLISWLLNRSFVITPAMQKNKNRLKIEMRKNRPLLTKTLYTVNSAGFLSCFKEKK